MINPFRQKFLKTSPSNQWSLNISFIWFFDNLSFVELDRHAPYTILQVSDWTPILYVSIHIMTQSNSQNDIYCPAIKVSSSPNATTPCLSSQSLQVLQKSWSAVLWFNVAKKMKSPKMLYKRTFAWNDHCVNIDHKTQDVMINHQLMLRNFDALSICVKIAFNPISSAL